MKYQSEEVIIDSYEPTYDEPIQNSSNYTEEYDSLLNDSKLKVNKCKYVKKTDP